MIDIYNFVSALNEASEPTDIINPSASGMTANIILQTWTVKQGQRFCTNFVLGEMGAGLPCSIGAALATGRRVIHIEGDGDFQLNIQELETIRRLNLPIIMFIINNNGYHSIRLSQMAAFGRLTGADDTSGLTLPDLEDIANAYKIDYGWILDTDNDFDLYLSHKMPYILEVFADPNQQYRHRVKSKLVDGKMVTAPMNEVE
jgi:acetolactate synthase-1/2/3 large subunit